MLKSLFNTLKKFRRSIISTFKEISITINFCSFYALVKHLL